MKGLLYDIDRVSIQKCRSIKLLVNVDLGYQFDNKKSYGKHYLLDIWFKIQTKTDISVVHTTDQFQSLWKKMVSRNKCSCCFFITSLQITTNYTPSYASLQEYYFESIYYFEENIVLKQLAQDWKGRRDNRIMCHYLLQY